MHDRLRLGSPSVVHGSHLVENLIRHSALFDHVLDQRDVGSRGRLSLVAHLLFQRDWHAVHGTH